MTRCERTKEKDAKHTHINITTTTMNSSVPGQKARMPLSYKLNSYAITSPFDHQPAARRFHKILRQTRAKTSTSNMQIAVSSIIGGLGGLLRTRIDRSGDIGMISLLSVRTD